MRGTWTSLFYRELHEQKWRSLSLAVIMASIAAGVIYVCVRDRRSVDDASLAFTMMAFGGTMSETRDLSMPAEGIDTLIINCGAGSLNLRGVSTGDKIKITGYAEPDDDLQSIFTG